MSISDFIARKKQELFLARDADKLALQKAELSKERERLEKQRNLEAEVRKEQSAIRDLRSQPARERFAAIAKGFKNLQAGAKKSEDALKRFDGNVANNSPFHMDSHPFGRDPPKAAPEKKARTIVVNIKD